MNTDNENNNSINNTPESENGPIKMILRKKWFLVLGGVILAILFSLIIFAASNKIQEPVSVAPTMIPAPTTNAFPTANEQYNNAPTTSPQSVELMKAIEDQKNVDREYSNWQVEIRKSNPMKGLPITSAKYFLYFDIDKKIFIGKLYPSTSDNIEQMQTEIMSKLSSLIGINEVEKYQIEWKIIPQ